LVNQRWRIIFLVGGVALAAAAILYQSASSWEARLDPSVAGNSGTVIGRVDEIRAFLAAFRESPVLGKGLGYRFSDPGSFDFSLAFGIFVPHNHFAFVAGTMGIVGLALYYGVLVSAWRRSRAISKRRNLDPEYRRTMIALVASLGTGFLFTLSSTSFTTLSYNLLIAVIVFASRLRWAGAEQPVNHLVAAPASLGVAGFRL
jgi:O-antigen ligase